MNNLIIYGGTFDPIHMGHLNTAVSVQEHFHFDRFHFLPCKTPLLKNEAHASAQHRIAMIKLALAELSSDLHFQIDYCEIERESPSYMVTTLMQWRETWGGDLPITLLLGQDTFYKLPAWYQWEKLLQLANLLVIKRPASPSPLPFELQSLLLHHETSDNGLLLTQPAGAIQQFDAGQYAISSTQIRMELAQGKKITPEILPVSVMHYIDNHGLYRS